MSRYNRYGFYAQTSVDEEKARNKKAVEKLMKKNPGIAPIIVSGRKLASTWWGKSWNSNLESYSDYSNRINRGRSYVLHGAVLHLQIAPGRVYALVQGSRKAPYEVEIDIEPLDKAAWNRLVKACEGKIESLQELLEGRFPKALDEMFTAKGKGLFPAPKEISFGCSCPDYAIMCKHVAAALYGVGTRLDEDPALFFVLRNVDVDELISKAVIQKSDMLLSKSERESSRIIKDNDLSAMFGIEMDEIPSSADEQKNPPDIAKEKDTKVPGKRGRKPKQPIK
jgi:uncharacterized Zn finger protein